MGSDKADGLPASSYYSLKMSTWILVETGIFFCVGGQNCMFLEKLFEVSV